MGLLIDPSVLIEAERGRLDLAAHVRGRVGEQVFVSVVKVSEMLFGAQRARDSASRHRRIAVAEALLSRFKVLDLDVSVARLHAQVKAELAARGTPVGPHDLWLAATCLAHGLTMVTANVREFRRVPGLGVENWLEPA
jgi:tRNA(fMet)-specific endonuclease VapC